MLVGTSKMKEGNIVNTGVRSLTERHIIWTDHHGLSCHDLSRWRLLLRKQQIVFEYN